MNKDQINKLIELKKLMDSGLLSKEEVLIEKARILGNASNQTNTKDDITEGEGVSNVTDDVKSQEKKDLENASKDCSDISNDVEPSLEENPSITQEVNENDNDNETPLGDNGFFIFLTVAFVVFGIVILTLKVSKKSSETVHETPDVVTDSAVTNTFHVITDLGVNNNENIATESNEDEFSIDPWSGSLNIEGDIYRMCSTLAYITLSKTGKGMYSGTMELMLGDKDIDLDTHEPTGRFFDDQGHLTGKIRAKADGQTLTIVLDSYTISKPSEFFDDLGKGQQIFRLTYDGQAYSAQAVGKMQTFFDSIEIK